ncbi:MAG: class I SAM-dependent methyltransferase [Thermodesulfobacteriota bacterium]
MQEHTQGDSTKESPIYTRQMYELGYSRKSWRSSRRLLARCIREGKPGPILDIGCGLGFFVECCYKFGISCIGLEGSEYAVQAARKREPNLDMRHHYLENPFPFEDGTFSIVMCNQIIEHLNKEVARKVLRESYRVLSEGGTLIIYSPSIYNKKEAMHPIHINLHSPKSLKKELEKFGFKKVKSFNKSLKFELGLFNPLNKVIRILFALLPLPFLSASANCVATKINDVESQAGV